MDRLAPFLAAVGSDWPLAIEIRNPNYLSSLYFETLAAHRVTPVFCQGYFLPPIVSVYRDHREQLSGTSIVRLLGPDRKGIEKETGKRWDRIVAPKDDEMPAIADMVVDMLARGFDVVVNVNNHYEGSAPLTVEKLERLVDERRERFSQIL